MLCEKNKDTIAHWMLAVSTKCFLRSGQRQMSQQMPEKNSANDALFSLPNFCAALQPASDAAASSSSVLLPGQLGARAGSEPQGDEQVPYNL